jgi:serine/threonine protein kinase
LNEDEHFGPYAIHECLGTGGMAVVHRASLVVGPGVRRDVALKRLLPQYTGRKRYVEEFTREAKVLSGLDHPNVVKVLDFGRVGDRYYIAMEVVEGVQLLDLLRVPRGASKLPAPIGVVLAIASELCDVLDYASSGIDAFGARLHIVHRDLSPSNLLITHGGHLKVIDFGIAKSTAGERFRTNSGLVKGKLGYTALEVQLGKEVDARADQYSAGVIIWEMLVRRRLFGGRNDYDTVERVRTMQIAPPSTLNPLCPRELDAIVLRALARERDDRWPSAGELRAEIERVRAGYREASRPRVVQAWLHDNAPQPEQTKRGIVAARDATEPSLRLSTVDMDDDDDDLGGDPTIERPPAIGRTRTPGFARAPTPTPARVQTAPWNIVARTLTPTRLHRADVEMVEDPSKQIQIERELGSERDDETVPTRPPRTKGGGSRRSTTKRQRPR